MKFCDPGDRPARGFAVQLLIFLCLVIAACDTPAPEAEEPPASETSLADCIAEGYLSAQLYGGIRSTLAWDADNLECNGMIRPFGEGAPLAEPNGNSSISFADIRLTGRLSWEVPK